jgi:hypothetical protein
MYFYLLIISNRDCDNLAKRQNKTRDNVYSEQQNRDYRESERNYWLNTNSGVRHNKNCIYYHNTKYGRTCCPNEGRSYGICGG